MSISEFNGPTTPPERPMAATDIGAGSEIYRRIEQRQKPSSAKLIVPAVVLVVAAVAGGVAFETMNKRPQPPAPAPMSAGANPIAPMAETTPPPAAANPPTVSAPAPAPAPAVKPVREARAEPPSVSRVVHRRAASAVTDAQDAGAYAPAQTPVAPPVSNAAPPAAASPAPAPEASTPPVTAAPAPSSGTSSPTPSSDGQ